MKKILCIFTFLSIFLLTGCGEETKLVCRQNDDNLNVTHEISIIYKNEKPKKYIDKLIFENVKAAKQMETYANMGFKSKNVKRKNNVIISEYTMEQYEESFNKFIKKIQFEKRDYENNNYVCEEVKD